MTPAGQQAGRTPGPLGGAYHAWADFLERWSAGEPVDDTGLPALTRADFPEDTWQRLGARIREALQQRLQAWADALVAAVNAADDEFAAGRALAQARTGLHRIRALAGHPQLPADLREKLTAIIDEQTRRAQQDLEHELERRASREQDQQAVDARRRTLRDNPLTAVITATPPADPGGWSYDPADGPRRRIVPG
ncbi:hypothetical protein ABTY61_33705 [Kitasatospora sp. NPDC096128]|uniref:hypothetical protein n=1 Tax=Kitasatospora sp. NPDC096128 TaxID=3155547 RepID=UPI00331FCE32